MGQTCQDDTRTEISRPGKPGLTRKMVEKGIQEQHDIYIYIYPLRPIALYELFNIFRTMLTIFTIIVRKKVSGYF